MRTVAYKITPRDSMNTWVRIEDTIGPTSTISMRIAKSETINVVYLNDIEMIELRDAINEMMTSRRKRISRLPAPEVK